MLRLLIGGGKFPVEAQQQLGELKTLIAKTVTKNTNFKNCIDGLTESEENVALMNLTKMGESPELYL